MPDSSGGVRELGAEAARQLDGIWFTATFGDAVAYPLSPLAEQLSADATEQLAELLHDRGASLPRRNRRAVRVDGQLYHAFKPLERAARELSPSDPELLAYAIACEALPEVQHESARRARPSLAVLAARAARLVAKLRVVEQRALLHEQDASQHHRWLAEMDLGILPDDALSTTLNECVAIHRAARLLELDVALELVGVYGVLFALARRVASADPIGLVSAALIPDALIFPSAIPGLSLARWGSGTTPAAREQAEADFVAAFGERGPNEADPFAPRWSQSPELLRILSDKLSQRDPAEAAQRSAAARRAREAAIEQARSAAGMLDARVLTALLQTMSRLVLLRSRLSRVRARAVWMLRTVTLDVDRRLSRLLQAEAGTAFFLRLNELQECTVHPEAALLELAAERRRTWQSRRAGHVPLAAIGRAAHAAAEDLPLRGVGIGAESFTGRCHLAREFADFANFEAGGILVVRALDPSWAPALPLASAIVSDTGGLADEGVLTAAALGVPLLIGTRDAMQLLANGDNVRVDLREGTVGRA